MTSDGERGRGGNFTPRERSQQKRSRIDLLAWDFGGRGERSPANGTAGLTTDGETTPGGWFRGRDLGCRNWQRVKDRSQGCLFQQGSQTSNHKRLVSLSGRCCPRRAQR